MVADNRVVLSYRLPRCLRPRRICAQHLQDLPDYIDVASFNVNFGHQYMVHPSKLSAEEQRMF